MKSLSLSFLNSEARTAEIVDVLQNAIGANIDLIKWNGLSAIIGQFLCQCHYTSSLLSVTLIQSRQVANSVFLGLQQSMVSCYLT